jgi:predicted ATPase/class 3 adenylate cyclase
LTWLVRSLPTGTVTFLFSDIEGSTRLLAELGPARYAEALTEHRRVMRDAFTAAGGVEVDAHGDAFFVAFGDAAGAVSAAAVAQERLASGPVRVRMGIHSGEPLLIDGGYVGIDVHQGARVMSAGHGGQVVLSHTTRALVSGHGLVELGLHRLKDLTEPQPLYQLGDGDFPPLKTLYRSNLPVQPTPLVGREAELGDLLALLSQTRLVTLTGAGGSGKTRLALQAAAELVERFRDGTWWVSLATLRDPALVEPAIAQTVGAADGLAEYLRDKQLLLLLDNFEQVLDAGPPLAELLAEAPDISILVTSRARLGLAAEYEYAVPTMPPAEAEELFTTRARQLSSTFEPNDAVVEICRRLDGLPLAIELAAARTRILTLQQILDRLSESLDLLTSGARDAPERQRTLRATIEWSYDLLSGEEQALFRSFSVFAGGCTLEAAGEICDADLDALQSLVQKSLVRFTGERYWMLETIREYAGEQLTRSEAADGVRRRHADFFAALAEEADHRLQGRTLAASLVRLDAEHNNLRAALRYTSETGGEMFPRTAYAVSHYWVIRSHIDEAATWLTEALAQLPAEPSQLRARLLHRLGNVASLAGDYTAGFRLGQEALAVAEEIDDSRDAAEAWIVIGQALLRLGNRVEARKALERARELYRVADDSRGVLVTSGDLADLARESGDFTAAADLFRECVQLARSTDDLENLVWATSNLGLAALQAGERVEAEHALRESARQLYELAWTEGLVYTLIGLAALALDASLERAATILGAAQGLARRRRIELQPVEARLAEATRDELESELSGDVFAAALAAGEDMALDDVVEYALAS